jgi:hypothetical protein
MKGRASARLIASVSKFRPRFKNGDGKALHHSAILLLLVVVVVVVVLALDFAPTSLPVASFTPGRRSY